MDMLAIYASKVTRQRGRRQNLVYLDSCVWAAGSVPSSPLFCLPAGGHFLTHIMQKKGT